MIPMVLESRTSIFFFVLDAHEILFPDASTLALKDTLERLTFSWSLSWNSSSRAVSQPPRITLSLPNEIHRLTKLCSSTSPAPLSFPNSHTARNTNTETSIPLRLPRSQYRRSGKLKSTGTWLFPLHVMAAFSRQAAQPPCFFLAPRQRGLPRAS